jgi:galactokinase
MIEIQEFFRKQFGSSPIHVVHAPGRLELLGNHTDYNEGLVMSLAVDKYIYMAAEPRNDGKIELVTSAFPQREQFPFDRIERNPDAPWANYVKGVLLQLQRCGVRFTGFNAAIHGTIPLGAGMSSSAALGIATASIVRQLFPYKISESGCTMSPRHLSKKGLASMDKAERMALAKLCLASESQFVGVNCGLLDQISCLFGKAAHIVQIDCRHLTIEYEAMPPNISIVVCDSGVKHELADGEYNERRSHCESAARALGVPALRSVTPCQLEEYKDKLSKRAYQCAYHIVGENQRVLFGERALRENNLEQFGQYLFQSHESSRDFFENSCPDLDLLVELARSQPDCLGARLTGGGFGGATINLVSTHGAHSFQRHVSAEYEKRTGRRCDTWLCRIVDGVQ